MTEPSQTGGAGRWRRFWIVVGVFVSIAPLATASVIVSLLLGFGMIAPRLERVTMALAGSFGFSAPLALVSGLLFGWLAVFRGHARLWVALAPAVLMLPPVNRVVGEKLLYFDVPFSLLVLALFVLPLVAARYLSRPWSDGGA